MRTHDLPPWTIRSCPISRLVAPSAGDLQHAQPRRISAPLPQPLGDLVITGPTNTNVMDVRLILVGSDK
jgi:hypothetical protein